MIRWLYGLIVLAGFFIAGLAVLSLCRAAGQEPPSPEDEQEMKDHDV